MSEEEWLRATGAQTLLSVAARRVTERKSRLVVCACARLVSPFFLAVAAPTIIEAAERRAGQQPTTDEIIRVWECSAEDRLRSHFCLARIMEALVTRNAHEAAGHAIRNCLDLQEEVAQSAVGESLACLVRDIFGNEGEETLLKLSGTVFLASLVRDIFGNPFRPVEFSAWRTDAAVALARPMYESRDFGAMPILADALQEAGCDNADVLNHCRDATATHFRGCWVVDGVLGLE
jgi:hypothetical protein